MEEYITALMTHTDSVVCHFSSCKVFLSSECPEDLVDKTEQIFLVFQRELLVVEQCCIFRKL